MNDEVSPKSSTPSDFNKRYSLILLFVVIAFVHLPSLILRILWVEDGRSKNDFTVFIFLPVVGLYLMSLCPIILLWVKPRLAVSDRIWFRWKYSEFFRLPLLMLGTFLVIILINALARILHLPTSADYLLYSTHHAVFYVCVLIMITFLGPVVEEVFWRGYVQSTLASVFYPWVGTLGQALLFGLLHIHSPVLGMVKMFLLGLLFGIWCHRRKTLLPVIIMHIVNNFAAVVIRWPTWFWIIFYS